MKCLKCGTENANNSRFCRVCGEKLELETTVEAQENFDKKAEVSGDNKAVGRGNLLFVFSLLCAFFYALGGLSHILFLLDALKNLLNGSFIFAIVQLVIALLGLFSGALTAFMLFLASKKWKVLGTLSAEQTERFLLGIVEVSVVKIAASVINLIISFLLRAITDGYLMVKPSSVGRTVILTILAVGIHYALIALSRQRPLLGRSLDDLKAITTDLFNDINNEIQQMSENVRMKKAQKAGKVAEEANKPKGVDTSKSLFKFIVFTILTCGIYGLYFYYTIIRDINTVCEEDGEKTTGLLLLIIFTLITCGIYGFFWDYKFADRLSDNAPRFGLTFKETGTTVLLWKIVGLWCCGLGPFIALYIQIKNLNKLAKAYNEAKFGE